METETKSGAMRLLLLWPLILAGEAIFLLPFVLPRLFKPTMLEVWGITNLDFGLAFTCYGVVAILAYGLGGPLADRYSARWLITIALGATALGGLLLLQKPSQLILCGIYAYFGMTTILLFWSAMLKTTHTLAGSNQQATAFGILDAGRGLFAAVFASLLTLLFTLTVPTDNQVSPDDLGRALNMVILSTIVLIAFMAFLVPFTLTKSADPATASPALFTTSNVAHLFRRPTVWLHGTVVLCAYCGYKSIDNYGIYSVDVYNSTDLEASQLTTLTFWARPIAAISAGLAADRFCHFKSLAVLFALAASGNLILAVTGPQTIPWAGLMILCVTTAAMMYGLRGIYFALFNDLHIPKKLIGTAAGIVSLIGFLPDVFFGALTGYMIDHHPGEKGYQMVFLFVASVSGLGFIVAVLGFRNINRFLKPAGTAPPVQARH